MSKKADQHNELIKLLDVSQPISNWRSYKKCNVVYVGEGNTKKTGIYVRRPGVVVAAFPSHIKIQLFSTQRNVNHDFYTFMLNGVEQHVRSIYERTYNRAQVEQLVDKSKINL